MKLNMLFVHLSKVLLNYFSVTHICTLSFRPWIIHYAQKWVIDYIEDGLFKNISHIKCDFVVWLYKSIWELFRSYPFLTFKGNYRVFLYCISTILRVMYVNKYFPSPKNLANVEKMRRCIYSYIFICGLWMVTLLYFNE